MNIKIVLDKYLFDSISCLNNIFLDSNINLKKMKQICRLNLNVNKFDLRAEKFIVDKNFDFYYSFYLRKDESKTLIKFNSKGKKINHFLFSENSKIFTHSYCNISNYDFLIIDNEYVIKNKDELPKLYVSISKTNINEQKTIWSNQLDEGITVIVRWIVTSNSEIIIHSRFDHYLGSDRIYKFSPSGELLWFYDLPRYTKCVHIDVDFNVYAFHIENNKTIMTKIDSSGKLISSNTSVFIGELDNLFIDKNGDIYVVSRFYYSSERENSNIQPITYLIKYDNDFNMLWIRLNENGISYTEGRFSVYEDKVVFYESADTALRCLDAYSGKTNWILDTKLYVSNCYEFSVSNGLICFLKNKNFVFLDVETGKCKFKLKPPLFRKFHSKFIITEEGVMMCIVIPKSLPIIQNTSCYLSIYK